MKTSPVCAIRNLAPIVLLGIASLNVEAAPDLVIDRIIFMGGGETVTVRHGQTVTLDPTVNYSWTAVVKNTGDASAGQSRAVAGWKNGASNCSVLPLDYFMGSGSIPALNPNTESSALGGTWQWGVAYAGTYSLVARADRDNQVPEGSSGEANNDFCATVNVVSGTADLVVDRVVFVGAGQTITIRDGDTATLDPTVNYSWTAFTKNIGTVAAGQSVTLVGWKNGGGNCTVLPLDYFMASGAVDSLPPGQEDGSPSGTWQWGVGYAGTYSLVARADRDNQVSEGSSGEPNNDFCATVTVVANGPDLAATRCDPDWQGDRTVPPGTVRFVDYTCQNQGTAAVPQTDPGLWLSTDCTTLDTTLPCHTGNALRSCFVNSDICPPSAPGQPCSDRMGIYYDAVTAIPEGVYCVWVRCDDLDIVHEIDEVNNVCKVDARIIVPPPCGNSIVPPDRPTGSNHVARGQVAEYCTNGADICGCTPLEYRLTWGDGSSSTWGAISCATHSWTASGTYRVRAQARCGAAPEFESSFSLDLAVEVTGAVAIVPSQIYSPGTHTLTLQALVTDSLYGPVTSGQFTWLLNDGNGVQIANGSLAYSPGCGCWSGNQQLASELPPDTYSVSYSIVTNRGRSGSLMVDLAVARGTLTVRGTIVDAANGSALQGAQVALFPGVQFWQYVNTTENGTVPALDNLLTSVVPVRGPSDSGSDGQYLWTNVPIGGSYVLVATKQGFLQRHAQRTPMPSGVSVVVIDVSLPTDPTTLFSLRPAIDSMRSGARSLVGRNAEVMASLSQRVQNDAILEDNAVRDAMHFLKDVLKLAAFARGFDQEAWNLQHLSNIRGIESVPPDVWQEAYNDTTGLLFIRAFSLLLSRGIVEPYAHTVADHVADAMGSLADSVGPVTKDGWLTSRIEFTEPSSQIDDTYDDILNEAGAVSLGTNFSRGLADRLGDQYAGIITPGLNSESRFVYPPQPASGVWALTLPDHDAQYRDLSNLKAQLVLTQEILGVLSIASSLASLSGLFTGGTGVVAGAVLGVGIAVATEFTVQAQARVQILMGREYQEAALAAYYDNLYGRHLLFDFWQFLKAEASSPRYLHKDNRFDAEINVALNLPTFPFSEIPVMWTLGIPGFDLARGVATVEVTNRGNTESEMRVTGTGTWSAVGFAELLGFGPGDLLTSCSILPREGSLTLVPGQTVPLAVPFAGYSRNFLSQFKPHYLIVDAYSGPWRAAHLSTPYFVLGLGESAECILNPLFCAGGFAGRSGGVRALRSGIDLVDDQAYVAPVSSKYGRLSVRDLRDSLAVGHRLTREDEVLAASAGKSVSWAGTFQVESGLFAADLRVFVPQDQIVSVLVADASGNRLGYSATDGTMYREIAGTVTNVGARPIVLRLLRPNPEISYTVEVTLLTPGSDSAPLAVFYEPVSASGGIMTVFPSPVIVDGSVNSTPRIVLRLSEASGQQGLSGVSAALGVIEDPDSGVTLAVPGSLNQLLPDVPASEGAHVGWDVVYSDDQPRCKYVGTAVARSNETTDLGIRVVALVRSARLVVSGFRGSDDEAGAVQETITLGPNGTGETWVHIPKGYRVVFGALGVVGASPNLVDPALDIGADGTPEWAFSGGFDLGVLVSDIENAFNAYIASHLSSTTGVIVPVRVTGPPGEKVLLNGVQLYLDYAGDIDFTGTTSLPDHSAFQECFSGPREKPTPTGGRNVCDCRAAFDFDGDGDIDLRDWAAIQILFQGP